MKLKKTVLLLALVVIVVVVLGRLAYINIPGPLTEEGMAESPNGRYVAKFCWKEYEPFWGGPSLDRIVFSIESLDGRVIRHITTREPVVGWIEGCSIEWANDIDCHIVSIRLGGWSPGPKADYAVPQWIWLI